MSLSGNNDVALPIGNNVLLLIGNNAVLKRVNDATTSTFSLFSSIIGKISNDVLSSKLNDPNLITLCLEQIVYDYLDHNHNTHHHHANHK